MCGRFAQPHSSEELARIFRARAAVDLPGQQFNVAPTDEVAGVVEHHGERVIEPFEVGKSLGEAAIGIGMRIMRDGESIGFWEEGAKQLKAGDRIIEVIPEYLFPKVAAAR